MPVVAITITTSRPGYSVTCMDASCAEWHHTYFLKRNADTAMIGHRIIKHSLQAVTQEDYDKARRRNMRLLARSVNAKV